MHMSYCKMGKYIVHDGSSDDICHRFSDFSFGNCSPPDSDVNPSFSAAILAACCFASRSCEAKDANLTSAMVRSPNAGRALLDCRAHT